jgi:hypothetical protein
MPASISFIRASRNERQWSVLGPARHIKFTTKTYMASPSWFSVVVRTLISPCSGRDFERLTSRTSLSRRLSSPGRTGRGWRNSSKPAPTMPPAGLGSVSTKSRVVTAAVDQPLDSIHKRIEPQRPPHQGERAAGRTRQRTLWRDAAGTVKADGSSDATTLGTRNARPINRKLCKMRRARNASTGACARSTCQKY